MNSEHELTTVAPPANADKLFAVVAAAAKRRGSTVKRTQSLVGNVILAQVLPDAAVRAAPD